MYHLTLYRSSHQRCSVKKGVLRNFAKFTKKHLCQSPFLLNTSERILLFISKVRVFHHISITWLKHWTLFLSIPFCFATLALNFCLSYSSADYVGVTFICIETCSKVKALSSVKLWSAWKILLKHLYFNDASLPLYSNLFCLWMHYEKIRFLSKIKSILQTHQCLLKFVPTLLEKSKKRTF